MPFGPDLLFTATDVPGFVLHVEICEDMFVPVPPSAEAALAGATVLANLSGSPITIGRAEDRCLLARSASSRCLAAYVYAAAGEGESTTDLAWDGQTMVWENGLCLAQSERFPKGERRSVADVDLELLRSERLRMGTFDDNRIHHGITHDSFRRVEFALDPPAGDIGLLREVERFPFVPADPTRLQQDCYEAYSIQVAGLEQRLRALNYPKVVLGVSGGLDSTHALIVAARAMDREGRPRSDILAFTLPGFATGERTKNNAIRLADALGVTFEEIDIKSTAELMLKEMEHPFARGEKVYDVTFENVQAGLRTDYLFRLANQRGGIVLGTGDLSELALGWSTYGVGDQMSHYNVNGGVPKTLIQHLIRWVISSAGVRRRSQRGAAVGARHRDHARTGAHRRGRGDPEQRGQGRTVCAAGFFTVPGAAVRVQAVEGRLPGVARVERPRPRRLACGLPGEQAADILAQGDSPLAAGLRASGTTRSPSSSGRRCPTGRRCRTADRCRPAATGGRRRTCRRASGSTRSNAKFPRTRARSKRARLRERSGRRRQDSRYMRRRAWPADKAPPQSGPGARS